VVNDPNTPPPSYFGALAPGERTITWQGHTNTVLLRVLEFGEEIACSRYARQLTDGHIASNEYLEVETLGRMARALVAVDGLPLATHFPTLDLCIAEIATFPGTLVDALVEAYVDVRLSPLVFLDEVVRDPNLESGRTATGSPSAPLSPPLSPPISGLSDLSTPPTMSKTARKTRGITAAP